MKKCLICSMLLTIGGSLFAGVILTDTIKYGVVSIQKDKRVDMLGEKMQAYNIGLSKNIRSAKGYRLMLLSTNDRNVAMQLRSKMLQYYPEHKVYMVYQNPFIKLKMGNFTDKAEADRFRKLLLQQKFTTGNIYLLPETIELKPVKDEEEN